MVYIYRPMNSYIYIWIGSQIMETDKFQGLQGEWPVGSPGETVVWFQSKGLLVKTEEEPMFSFDLECVIMLISQSEGS